jgi:hypothetical protein
MSDDNDMLPLDLEQMMRTLSVEDPPAFKLLCEKLGVDPDEFKEFLRNAVN